MERLTYRTDEGKAYGKWASGVNYMEKLADYEDAEELCIEECGCCLRMVIEKYKEFLEDMVELAEYRQAEEQGLLLRLPCKVGDKAYLIDKGENGHLKVYEGVWDSVAMAQRKNANFEVRGHISYDVYDFFYDDGRTMLHGMYVGQETTKFGKVVFLTREEAEQALEMQKGK